MQKLKLTITLGDDHELNLSANSMNELVDKIIKWQDWDSNKDLLPKKPKKNWYYYKNKPEENIKTNKLLEEEEILKILNETKEKLFKEKEIWIEKFCIYDVQHAKFMDGVIKKFPQKEYEEFVVTNTNMAILNSRLNALETVMMVEELTMLM